MGNFSSGYDHTKHDKACQDEWHEKKLFEIENESSDPEKNYYVLEMFPYPSGDIHVGHARNYVMGDILARFKRHQGYHVLHPMGFDAFGLPAENAAIERGVHPKDWTYKNISTMRTQLKLLGLAVDWSREIITCDPSYYKHEQEMFIDFYHEGLVERTESYVNWDPVEQSVLANEQVVNGRGWRSNAVVERMLLPQWSLKISDMAEDLLEKIDTLEGWPSEVRLMQKNWIGKSTGAVVNFAFEHSDEDTIDVYTTRPDTLFGASFCGLAFDHPLVEEFAREDEALQAFVRACQMSKASEAAISVREKEGFLLPLRVRHPLKSGELLPVFATNFVLMDYGTGAIFGCPAHDERDFEFAKKYDLPIIRVVAEQGVDHNTQCEAAYTGEGVIINSDFLNGLAIEDAKQKAIEKLELLGKGKAKINYRIHDWGVSRQRYWGCPIPFVHCKTCGLQPVDKKDLPITLPYDVDFSQGGNPLRRHPTWKHTSCPKCKGEALRETDTLDTFFESSWYFARFCDPKNDQSAFDKRIAMQWLPVDQYIGGIEHAVMHLLYSRFFVRGLSQCGYLDGMDEPFTGLFNQGLVCHETYQLEKDGDGPIQWLSPDETILCENGQRIHKENGKPVIVGRSEKMSKSKRNTVDYEQMLSHYGADTLRLFVVSDSPLDRTIEWTTSGIGGARRFLDKVWRVAQDLKPIAHSSGSSSRITEPNIALEGACKSIWQQVHVTVDKVTHDFTNLSVNTAIASIRALCNALDALQSQEDEAASFVYQQGYHLVIRMLSPIMPHMTHMAWKHLYQDEIVSELSWPEPSQEWLKQETILIPIQVNGKLRDKIEVDVHTSQEELQKLALSQEKIQANLQGLTVKRVIVVASKIVNIVTES